jgi:TrmH family RNA methyltransferase
MSAVSGRITSRNNPLFRELLKLAHSSHARRKSQLVLLDGPHLVESYLDHVGTPRHVVVSEAGLESPEIRRLLGRASAIEPTVFGDALFAQLSPVATPAGILALGAVSVTPLRPADIRFCVLLEDIQDPGNMGSILRSAAAAGADSALLSAHCAYAWSPKVLRAGMGTHFRIAIHEHVDLSAFVAAFPGHVVATDAAAATSVFDADLGGQLALVIGNEGGGLSPALRAAAQRTVRIPMAAGSESLNAGAAAAVCLFERVRQMHTKGNAGS